MTAIRMTSMFVSLYDFPSYNEKGTKIMVRAVKSLSRL